MSRRLQLHDIFIDILGTRNQKDTRVYFQPPSTVKIKYPCIIYRRNDVSEERADDLLYLNTQSYQVTVVDANPDSLIPNKILHLPLCRAERHYTADNLNHDVFIIHY